MLLDLSASGAKVRFDRTRGEAGTGNRRAGRRLKIATVADFPVEVVWQDGPFVGLRFLSDPHEVAGSLEAFLPPKYTLADETEPAAA